MDFFKKRSLQVMEATDLHSNRLFKKQDTNHSSSITMLLTTQQGGC